MLAFKAEKDTGWDINQRIGELKDDVRSTSRDLLKVRDRIGTEGFKACTEVCGAFVTFEEQPAQHAALKLFGGDGTIQYLMQKSALRLNGRRLKAYAAPQPRDVLHENLPFRILAFNLRGLTTALRRVISYAILSLFMLISFATSNPRRDSSNPLLATRRSSRSICSSLPPVAAPCSRCSLLAACPPLLTTPLCDPMHVDSYLGQLSQDGRAGADSGRRLSPAGGRHSRRAGDRRFHPCY